MLKTSKLQLTETQYLHSDKMEQMSSLEAVKVKHRGKCNLSLHWFSLRFPEKLVVQNSWKSCTLCMLYSRNAHSMKWSACSPSLPSMCVLFHWMYPVDRWCRERQRTHHQLECMHLKFIMTVHASEEPLLYLHGLLTVALGKGIKLLSLPHIHLPPTIAPIEPVSLGGVTLIFTTHLHPPATTIPTGNIISLHILCIQHKGVGECAECRCVCVGVGKLRCFLLCIHGCDMPVVKRVLKRV